MASYTAGIVYNTSIEIGSSRKYGSAYVENADTYNGGGTQNRSGAGESQTKGYDESIVVGEGTRVRFVALPDTTIGFKFKGWYSLSTGTLVSSQTQYQRIVSGGDIFLVPAFEPNNPTFTRSTTVTINGAEETNIVCVQSMNGYYTYGLNGGTNRFNYNNTKGADSENLLPDGKPFDVLAKVKDGYEITFRVNGTVVNPNIWSQIDEDYSGTQDRGATPENPIDTSLQYTKITVQNYANQTTPITVTVTYTQTVQYATVTVASNGNGSVRACITGESTTWYTRQVPVGTSVTITGTPNSGYHFIHWTDGLVIDPANPKTFTVSGDVTWRAQFNKSTTETTMTVKAEPTNGGSVWITLNGTTVSGNSITSTQAGSGTVAFHAAAANNYQFLYWYEATSTGRTLDTPDITVTFGDSDKDYRAVFQYTPSGYVQFKAYTSIQDGATFIPKAGNPQVTFEATYRASSSSTTTTKTIGATEEDVRVYIQSSGIGNYVVFNLKPEIGTVYPIVLENRNEYYRYALTGYKYSNTYISSPSGSSFQDCVLDDSGNWRLNLDSATQNQVHTLTGVLKREQVHELKVRNSTTGEPNGSSNITVTGSGWYSSADSITVTATVNQSIDSHRYTFTGWAWSTDTSTIIDTNESYTFRGLDADKTIVAVYVENCKISFWVDPAGSGTVEAHDTVSLSTIPNNSWVEYGTEITIRVVPTASYTVLYWSDGGINSNPGETSITFVLRSPDTMWKVYLADKTNNLVVTSNQGGTVSVELRDPNGNYSDAYAEDPDVGYEIPSGYGFRATAIPDPRYSFSSFTLYNSGGTAVDQTQSTVYEVEEMTGDSILNAVFTFISWISTLKTIMKVF